MPTPKKSLGQHWLFDDQALQAMVQAGEVGSEDTILEIGPGLGSLTLHLAQAASQVVAVELDPELAATLKERVTLDNIEVVESDILTYDLASLPANYKVVANIPYFVTSKIVQLLLESSNPPAVMALLMQKEVAERITAAPGAMSVLAFSVQYYAQPSVEGVVAKELFEPVPKVDSAILKLVRRDAPYFEADNAKLFRLVKAGFGERRKKLANSLAGGLALDKGIVRELLESAKINQQARAQELSMDDWGILYTKAIEVDIL